MDVGTKPRARPSRAAPAHDDDDGENVDVSKDKSAVAAADVAVANNSAFASSPTPPKSLTPQP